MMNVKRIILIFFVAILGAFVGVFLYAKIVRVKPAVVTINQPISFTKLPPQVDLQITDFTYAAEKSVHAVVHIKTQSTRETYYRHPLYDFFYGDRYHETEPVVGFGSGVILTNDGFIVTNNHVIENSQEIFVTLNDKREFQAKLIGADPSTDLAVLKIDAENLPVLEFGDSDNLKVGEWVLAVGNPFNLTSSVTAGIVSAKGRNLGIIDDEYRLESFIQTDASLNRGNSGGALVDIRGQLIGINTAIMSPSGGSVGNSFAIPTSIVGKIVNDLIEFGSVQRAILGVTIDDVTSEKAKELKLDEIAGVYIKGIREKSAAKEAGLKVGDVIIMINEKLVNSTAELQEQISRYRPKDKIIVTIIRDNKKKQFEVVLRNMAGDTELVTAETPDYIFGARFGEVSENEKEKLGLKNGIKITDLKQGKLMAEGVKEGFIITRINNLPVNSIHEIKTIIDNTSRGVYVEGVYPDGKIKYYAFGLE